MVHVPTPYHLVAPPINFADGGMIELIVAFLCGSFLTVLLSAAGLLGWVYAQSRPVKDDASSEERPYIRPQLPQVKKDHK